MIAPNIHTLPPGEVYSALDTSPTGLLPTVAAQRMREYGCNVLESTRSFHWARSIIRHSLNFFCLLLYVSAGACFVAESIQPGQNMHVLGWALLAVAALNATFSFIQEYRADRAMDELRKFLPQRVRVRRAAQEEELLATEVVPGDVLILTEGDRVSADARLIEANALLVNNAPLTGESRAVPLAIRAARGPLIESRNIVFAGCSVLRGTGVAVAFATGRRTQFGQIAALSQEIRRPRSPLEQELNRMVRVLTAIAVSMGAAFFVYGVMIGRPLWVNLVFMLGIIVANVPEGLLPTFTLALSMASLRMARKNVLVKSLEAIETLGAVHVICTDKTGTLTRNELAISRLVDVANGQDIRDGLNLHDLLRAALIASEIHPHNGMLGGDPLDVAVANLYGKRWGDLQDVTSRTRRHFPFDLRTRREAGLFVDGDEILFAVKGAWENLRPLIGQIACSEGHEPVAADAARLEAADRLVHDLASQGHRVIAVASRKLTAAPPSNAPEESLEQKLTLCGLMALDDPLRAEAPEAVSRCRDAGIRVILITGDHPDTALAIARQCGIVADDGHAQPVVLGAELDQLNEGELIGRLSAGSVVFARTTPEQKTKIVSAIKRMGLVVAMTGDGVNDAPALKAANVGISMGQGGTDVARESSDLVLLDNNFASIVAGVEEGRAVFANMQQFTSYVLTSNVPEIAPYLLYVTLPVPLALTVIQILSIDLGTDIIPAIGLGQEPPDRNVMRRLPRSKSQRLLSARMMLVSYLFLGVIQAVFSLGMFFFVLWLGGWRFGNDLSESDPLYRSATGITLATVVLMQIANVIGRRRAMDSGLDRGLLSNRLILLGIAVEIAFSWALLYSPPFQAVLGTAPVDWPLYLLAWTGLPLFFGIDLMRKRLVSRRREQATPPQASRRTPAAANEMPSAPSSRQNHSPTVQHGLD